MQYAVYGVRCVVYAVLRTVCCVLRVVVLYANTAITPSPSPSTTTTTRYGQPGRRAAKIVVGQTGTAIDTDEEMANVEVSCHCIDIQEPAAGYTFRIGQAVRITWQSACFCQLRSVDIELYVEKREATQ